MSTAVVHLVWQPLGMQPFQDFMASYRQHPAGQEHDLILLYNGCDAIEPYEQCVSDLPHHIHHTPPLRDLSAYTEVMQATGYEYYCLLNSHSVLLADRWLDLLLQAATGPGVGAAGATGSWESFATNRALMSLDSSDEERQLAHQRYPPFPNPHLRTTGLVVPRQRWLGYEPFRHLHDKAAAYQAESGFNSFSRTLPGDLLLVGRDGQTWPADRWPHSNTFRYGDQHNLLIADNQTRAYQAAPPVEQARWREVTWGCWTGMRDHGTWSPMALLRHLDLLTPALHPDKVLPLYWEDSESDTRLSAALDGCIEWWQQMGLPAERVRARSTRAVMRRGTPYEAVMPFEAGHWQVAWSDPFPTLSTPTASHAGQPLPFLLADAAVRLRDTQLHGLWRRRRHHLDPAPIVAAFPDRAESTLLLAQHQERLHHYEDALSEYRRAQAIDPGYPDGHLGAARCLLALGRTREARAPIDQILQQTPFHPGAWKLKWQARQGPV